MQTLATAVAGGSHHRLHAEVAPLAAQIANAWNDFGTIPSLPLRIGHGDPKISNFLFDTGGRITGVIDLDTMAWTGVDIEIGDALRSWCNRASEDATHAEFDLDVARAGLQGYLAGAPWLTPEERAALPDATQRICLELAARFAADALHESYFGWDPAVAPSRGEHNLLRARGQLALAHAARAARGSIEAIVLQT
jgi:aminoglycoside phosphotransferase (APT) family kinase protein